MATSYDYLFKLLIVGGRESNKHKMLEKFLSQNNATAPVGNLTTGITYGSASGIDYKLTNLNRNGRKIRLQIWDTAGQERFRSVTSSFYRGSHGAVLVFSLAQQPSFPGLEFWLKEIRENVPKRCVVLLVGTMSSGEAVREVSVQAMEEFSAAQEVQYFECDLDHVNQSGVNEIFTSLVDTIVDNILVGGQNFENSIKLNDSALSDTTSKSCCK
ncbi:ras-related protein Rab-13-like [Dysidea avara]|uniref:ras-related protein Rab-13-like n=1 Tax=Dysidea avara TaxID=196820 RepID=UPI003331DBDB